MSPSRALTTDGSSETPVLSVDGPHMQAHSRVEEGRFLLCEDALHLSAYAAAEDERGTLLHLHQAPKPGQNRDIGRQRPNVMEEKPFCYKPNSIAGMKSGRAGSWTPSAPRATPPARGLRAALLPVSSPELDISSVSHVGRARHRSRIRHALDRPTPRPRRSWHKKAPDGRSTAPLQSSRVLPIPRTPTIHPPRALNSLQPQPADANHHRQQHAHHHPIHPPKPPVHLPT
jgi:hypothetical protein